jgi:superfamily I DNA/RNA helicase
LASLIRKDWDWLRRSEPPHFIDLMRHLRGSEDEIAFYFGRANYYDAVDFDDSVYRTYERLLDDTAPIAPYELVLIDEYQDFNQMEAGVIELLALSSPIVVAGDDDQALYGQLRAASWDHIRALYAGGQYEVFNLPFCMRCPEVIVDAVNDVIQRARAIRKLHGRIDKPYRHYEPVKGEDSRRYPTIGLVTTTVQRLNANYFGRYLERYIGTITQEEIDEARERHEPAVLIIGNKQYLRQIEQHLTRVGFAIDARADTPALDRNQGLEILNETPDANLGWRIVLAFETEAFAARCVREANDDDAALMTAIPAERRAAILNEATEWAAQHVQEGQVADAGQVDNRPYIKMTSYEGAKGLSAQHVFIVGLHAGDLPHDAANIQDIEICRLVVALTRTKKVLLMLTGRFANDGAPTFLSWVDATGRAYSVDARFGNRLPAAPLRRWSQQKSLTHRWNETDFSGCRVSEIDTVSLKCKDQGVSQVSGLTPVAAFTERALPQERSCPSDCFRSVALRSDHESVALALLPVSQLTSATRTICHIASMFCH